MERPQVKEMKLKKQLFGYAVVLFVVGAVAVFISRVPVVTVGDTTLRTGVLFGAATLVLLLPHVVSEYRSGNVRTAVQWGLFAVGIPLSLTSHTVVAAVGVAFVLSSLVLSLSIDRRFRRRSSE